MATRDLGQSNCPHETVRTEQVVHHNEGGKEVIIEDQRAEFDRRFCADCNKWLGDTKLRLEPILIACC
jgi:hypothetical protein